MALSHEMMEGSILVSGVMANSMALESMSIMMECRERDFGRMEKELNGFPKLKSIKILDFFCFFWDFNRFTQICSRRIHENKILLLVLFYL